MELVVIPIAITSQHSACHLEAIPHTYLSSYKPSVPKAGECSTPSTSEYREDNLVPLSLLSLSGDVMEALQAVIVRRELDLDEFDPLGEVIKTWVPRKVVEQIWQANFLAVEDEHQVMDWLIENRG